MTKFSLRQAAQQAGISKSTVLRAIQSGRLSAARTDDGGYSIDASELCRVYPAGTAQQVRNAAAGQDAPSPATSATPDDPALLRAEIEGLKAQLALMRENAAEIKSQRDDLRSERDDWKRMAENSQRMLEDQRSRRRGLFGLLRG